MSEKANEITKGNDDIIDATEFDAAEKEAKNSKDVYTHKFLTPFTYEGKKYDELVFEWAKLTGEDYLAIESELNQFGKPVIAPEFSTDFLIRMASRACTVKIGSDMITALSLRDFNRIRGKARSFLMSTAL